MDWQFLLFNPNGRIGQKDFWIGAAILLGGNILANILPILGGLLWLLLIWVGICVYGKRLHDIGQTALIHLIPWALNFLVFILAVMMVGGAIISAWMSGGDVGPGLILSAGGGLFSLMSMSVLIWAGYTIWLGLALGENGANQYGPEPAIEMKPAFGDGPKPQSRQANDDAGPGGSDTSR